MALKQYIRTKVDPPWIQARARRSWMQDPETRREQVYEVILRSGEEGVTRNEISSKTNLAPSRVSLYLSELMRQGFVEVKGAQKQVDVTQMSEEDAVLYAMTVLESALVVKARAMLDPKTKKVPPDMEKSFARYQKTKELVLRPGTPAEGKVALRMAVLELVRLVF